MEVALHVFSEATARWFADTFPERAHAGPGARAGRPSRAARNA